MIVIWSRFFQRSQGIFILLMTHDMYGNALMHSLKSPELHYEIGGDWKHYCTLQWLSRGTAITIGAPAVGRNSVLFITLIV